MLSFLLPLILNVKELISWFFGIFKAYPREIIILLMGLGLIFCGYSINSKNNKIENLTTQVKTEQQKLKDTIKANNAAIDNLKNTYQKMIDDAKKEVKKNEPKINEYNKLGEKYSKVDSSGSCETRIEREENLNSKFIEDWRKI